MKIKLLFICCLFSLVSFAQKEASVWYFGQNAGVKFQADGSVTGLTDGELHTIEGCASIADSDGNLMFYTDGEEVWDKTHKIMLNGAGLKGSWSTSQSATIVPLPGSTTLYYIFTLDYEGRADGFRYSIVDMTLNGGLGGVTSTKNILIYTPSNEKLAVIKHSNNEGYWIVTHGWKNNTFRSYLLTSTGLSSTFTASNVGVITTGEQNIWGCMKIAPNGTKLAICNSSVNAELFDFNTTTGVVSNPIVLSSNRYNYGVEFSPNSELLYLSFPLSLNSIPLSASSIKQFDLTASDVVSSGQDVLSSIHAINALQLGPNGKIYFAQYNTKRLGVINNPNSIGASCDAQINVIDLLGRECTMGLPSFISSFFFVSDIEFDNACVGRTTNFWLKSNKTINSATWDFGDGTTSTTIKPTHTYLTEGLYTVKVTATSSDGTSIKTRDVFIPKAPTASQPQDILVCDDNNDGLNTFDLTTQNTAILNGQDPNLYKVNYFANTVAIQSPGSYTNPIAYQQETITAEVSNFENSSCVSSTSFVIKVLDSPLPELAAAIPDLNSCDNSSFGTDIDGRIVFDLTQRATAILKGQSASQFLISYYKDAGLTQHITIPTAYQNTVVNETIFVKVVNKDLLTCIGTTFFKIKVFALPVITAVVDLKQCDDDIDGFSVFNLEEAIPKITSNALNETIDFFKTLADAEKNISPILDLTRYINSTVSNDVVYVRVNNANACFRVAKLDLTVSTTQIPTTFSKIFNQCDDDASGTNVDGIATFDFSSVTSEIESILPSGQLQYITYYRNLDDTLAEKNAIADISNYRNIGYPNSQKIYVRVDSKINNDCLGLGDYVTLNINSLPDIPLIGNELVCSDLPTFTKIINAGLADETQKTNYTYTWTLDGNLIAGENNYDLIVNKKGVYKIEVTSSEECSRTRTITVSASEKAKVQVEIVDLSDENSITVLATGTGDYVFSLDNEFGDYQENNIFANVSSGIHTIYVKDLNGCGVVPKDVAVLGIPKFFTPNQDGYNDTWNLKGINSVVNAKTAVRIFDRYGKLIKELNPMDKGWDGTYIGQQMPSTDYWYSIEFEDGRVFKGHFALKR